MMLMTPGLTEEECRRYQELLEVKGQYERGSQAPIANGEEEEGQGAEPREELRAPPSLSEHEVALIEEELRHLEFKCRNILRAQKMQQLRERCLKAWMMEEETAAATAAGSHNLPVGLTFLCFFCIDTLSPCLYLSVQDLNKV